jgi:hypothetical protein
MEVFALAVYGAGTRVQRVGPRPPSLTLRCPLCRFCATGAFDGDAFMLDGFKLPAWTAHLEYQEICGPSPGQALR